MSLVQQVNLTPAQLRQRIELTMQQFGTEDFAPSEWQEFVLNGDSALSHRQKEFVQTLYGHIKSYPKRFGQRPDDVEQLKTDKLFLWRFMQNARNSRRGAQKVVDKIFEPFADALQFIADGGQTLARAIAVQDALQDEDMESVGDVMGALRDMFILFNALLDCDSTKTKQAIKLVDQFKNAAQSFSQFADEVFREQDHDIIRHPVFCPRKGRIVMIEVSQTKLRRARGDSSEEDNDDPRAAKRDSLVSDIRRRRRLQQSSSVARVAAKMIKNLVYYSILFTIFTLSNLAVAGLSAVVSAREKLATYDQFLLTNAVGTLSKHQELDVNYLQRLFYGWVENISENPGQRLGVGEGKVHRAIVLDWYLALNVVMSQTVAYCFNGDKDSALDVSGAFTSGIVTLLSQALIHMVAMSLIYNLQAIANSTTRRLFRDTADENDQ